MVVNLLSEESKNHKGEKSIKFSPSLFRRLSKMFNLPHMYISNLFKNTNLEVKRMLHCLYMCAYIAVLGIEPRTLNTLGEMLYH